MIESKSCVVSTERSHFGAVCLVVVLLWTLSGGIVVAEDTGSAVSTVGPNGVVTIHPPKVEPQFRNPASDAYEKAFSRRYNQLLTMWTRNADGSFGKIDSRRFFESEKWSYPHAMLHVLAGNVTAGMAVLQAEDQPQRPKDNAHTLGIDLYPAFTLKGQIRKYFQFGPLMDEEYRSRMSRAVDLWTRTHPRYTPHPIYKKYHPNRQGWGPDRFGHRQVDGRRTDNLYAMSTTAVYLFAEASGNEKTRQKAKDELLGYVWALYNIGHGEWDSTAYHPHVMAPYLNLYDFARDEEVKMAAKLALDHFSTAAAIKYQRGAFVGASKRDYGGPSYRQMGSSCMAFFELYFGHAPDQEKEFDQLFAMASSYRPPAAVLALAAKELDGPVEILACKPDYENWKPGGSDRPRNFETIWLGRHASMGSTIDPGGNGDLAPFRIVMNRGRDGADVMALSSTGRLNTKMRGDQIAQYANLAVWMAPAGRCPWTLLVPAEAQVRNEQSVMFIEGQSSWISVRRYGVKEFEKRAIPAGKAGDKHRKQFGDAVFYTAPAAAGATLGAVAIEIGEKGQFRDAAAFRDAVLGKGKMSVDGKTKSITLTGANGKVLQAGYNDKNDLPIVKRDGQLCDWDDPKQWSLWKTVGDKTVVDLGWKTGKLTVEADGKKFTASFQLTAPKPVPDKRELLEKAHGLRAKCTFSPTAAD